MPTSSPNVMLGANRLIPLAGSTTVAHGTRQKILDQLAALTERHGRKERAMIVDISALVWNFDTYAIVGGTPTPVKVKAKDRDALRQHLALDGDEKVKEGVLVPQSGDAAGQIWVPAGATLKSSEHVEAAGGGEEQMEFLFEPAVDPNNDRLEHWEQQVIGATKQIETSRAKQAVACMCNMVRFFELDKIICWDLSWGLWEAEKQADGAVDANGFPLLVVKGSGGSFTALGSSNVSNYYTAFNALAMPITTELIADAFKSASGYYLLGGNTYTMSLYHNMWDKQEGGGHKQLLRDLLTADKLFYMGHSAGAIMSGPNILTATFKSIDAVSIAVQPYNAPYVRLPPSETPEKFFLSPDKKNDLLESRTHMLEKMRQYNAWEGFRVVEALTFPHYDSRPQFTSFPQSAETYLRATDTNGMFKQEAGTLLLAGTEAPDVKELREQTNASSIPCLLIANGHSMVLPVGGTRAVETYSPEEEGQVGVLHWDTYMPVVVDKTYDQYTAGRTQFSAGSLSGTAIAGDRGGAASEYNGGRVVSRLQALGLPTPAVGEEGLFRARS